MPKRLWFYYAGFVIVLAFLLGGGTVQGLWTDRVIQIALIPALFLGLGRIDDSRWSLAAKILAAATILLLALNFLPIGRDWPGGESATASGIFWTVAASRTFESMLVYLPVLSFALFLSRFADQDQERLLRFVVVGLLINLGVGAFQLSSSATGAGDANILPYALNAGVFVNPNHFSALVNAVIPIFAYFYLRRTSRPLFFGALLALMLLYLFAVGSRAGMGISLCVAAISILMFAKLPRLRTLRPIMIAIIILMAAGLSTLQPDFLGVSGTSRGAIYMTTIRAFLEHWIFGTGIGTFENVYPIYEDLGSITSSYVNHAHNDFLELALEAGIPGLALMAGFFVLVFRGAGRTQMAKAYAVSVIAIAAHSLVDYPARTMAIAVLLAVLTAHLFSIRGRDAPARQRRSQAS